MIAHARFAGKRIDTRALEKDGAVAHSPLVLRAGERGRIVVFRFGVYVAFDVGEADEARFSGALEPHLIEPHRRPETETAEVVVHAGGAEGVDAQGRIVVSAPSVERLQVVASVLAKSTVLAHYEVGVADVFDRVDALAELLQRGARPARGRELAREIGNTLLIQSRMIGHVEVSEKPDITWDDPALDRFYERLSAEYELVERERALSRKLDLIAQAAQTVLDLFNQRQSIRVEWYIVVLIVVEIAIILYEMWRG